MRTFVNKTVVTNVLNEVSCDCCGKSIDVEDTIEMQELLHVCFTGGYGAILGDGTTYTTDLCQECVVKVLGPYLKEVPERDLAEDND